MQLIDVLEKRSDSVNIWESPGEIRFVVDEEGEWWVSGNFSNYKVEPEAMKSLLNLLRIPIKYIERCIEEGGHDLAEASVNYWVERFGRLSFLTSFDNEEFDTVTQVFPGQGLFLPGVRVNDLVVDYLGDCEVVTFDVKDDVFTAVYLSENNVVIGDSEFTEGISVLFSDCFSVTPRFDGVLYERETGEMYSWPTTRRKFRVSSSTITQVVYQISDFLEYSIVGMRENLTPAIESFFNDHDGELVDVDRWVSRLCGDLRLSKKVKADLMGPFTMNNYFIKEIISEIASLTVRPTANIDISAAREIQVGISTYIMEGNFK